MTGTALLEVPRNTAKRALEVGTWEPSSDEPEERAREIGEMIDDYLELWRAFVCAWDNIITGVPAEERPAISAALGAMAKVTRVFELLHNGGLHLLEATLNAGDKLEDRGIEALIPVRGAANAIFRGYQLAGRGADVDVLELIRRSAGIES